MEGKIKLSHGDGGQATNDLIKDVFLRQYGDVSCDMSADSYVFSQEAAEFAFTTDSFVVKPLFFRGGDIGKLSVCGTINDLAAAGARALYISAGFIIEEGFEIGLLCRIARSMSEACRGSGVRIVTGDTKVVEKGGADGLYINTSGIGIVSGLFNRRCAQPGDEIIVSGPIAEHGTAILIDRFGLNIETDIISDCGPLDRIADALGEDMAYIKRMKDPTRGGLATVLNEMAESSGYDIELTESQIPVNESVRAINGILGTDPLYLACEGRMVLIAERGSADSIAERLRRGGYSGARRIGQFTAGTYGMVYINTVVGGKRILPACGGQTVPRIC